MSSTVLTPPHSPFTSTTTTTSLPLPPRKYHGYHHIHFYVGNALQASTYYTTRFGFQRVAYRGLETGAGSRVLASHVVRNGNVTFVLTSPLRSVAQVQGGRFSEEEKRQVREVAAHLERHGDGVRDVAFEVDDVEAVFRGAVERGAEVVEGVKVLKGEDGEGEGEVKMATIRTYGDTVHTLVERKGYRGVFLPGYRAVEERRKRDPVERFLPGVELENVDHCVGNQDWEEMERVCEL